MSGSHIDTVVEGGHLDGQFGVLAATVAMESLKATHGQPLRVMVDHVLPSMIPSQLLLRGHRIVHRDGHLQQLYRCVIQT